MHGRSSANYVRFVFGLVLIGSVPLAALAQAHSLPKDAGNGASNAWSVRKTGGRIVAANLVTKTGKTLFIDVNEEDETSTYEIASLAGPVLSVSESLYWEGGAHPGHLVRLKTINLDTGKTPVLLSELFPEGEILKALLDDKVVRKALGDKRPGNLAELAAMADGGCEIGFELINESFAFHHLKGGKAAVRIGLPHGCEAMRGNYTELGIYLPIPPNFAESLRRADRNRTLLKFQRNRQGAH